MIVEIIGKDYRRKSSRDARTVVQVYMGVKHQIWQMRKARGWTQAELGRRAGMPKNVISRMERPDDRMFTMRTLVKIANAFDVGLEIKFQDAILLSAELRQPDPQQDRGRNLEKEWTNKTL